MRRYLLTIISVFLFFGLHAQTDTTAADSANQYLQDETLKLQQLESQLVSDSLKKMELQRELEKLKSTDALKKQDLLNELEALKSDEAKNLALKKAKIDSLRSRVKGYPVVPFRDTLFYVYTRSGSFSPAERAAAITERLRKAEKDYLFHPDSVKVLENENGLDIVFNDATLMSLSRTDAMWADTTIEGLAAANRTLIVNSVQQHKKETSWQTILKEIGLAILVIIALTIIIRLTNNAFRRIRKRIVLKKGVWFRGVRLKNYQLFTAEKQIRFVFSLLNILKWVLIILLIYLALPVLFSIFPATEGIAQMLISYIMAPVKKILFGIWNYLPNLITIIVIIIIFRYILKGIRFLKDEIERGELVINGFHSDWANPTYQLIRVVILAFMLIVIFPYLPGSDSPIFQGVSVFIGFIITFGSAGALSNIVAGMVLTYMRQFKIGDRVKIGDVTGDVVEKTLLVTRVRTIKNEVVSISNSNVMSNNTINYTTEAVDKGLIVHTTVTIGYDVPWRQVHELLINAALEVNFILRDPAPFILQTSLDDYYVSYQLNAYTRDASKQAVIYSEIHKNIQDKFNEANVEIMSPHYRALRDGNQVTIPTDYLPQDYITPSFRVKKDEGDNA